MITKQVKIIGKEHFYRENYHTHKPIVENFFAISMQADDGIYVTFIRCATEFAQAVEIGDNVTVSGKVKRKQDYNKLGGQTVLTYCKVGVFKSQQENTKREAKRVARLAKLGL